MEGFETGTTGLPTGGPRHPLLLDMYTATLDGQVVRDEWPFWGGRDTDTFKGWWFKEKVVIKNLRKAWKANDEARKNFAREIQVLRATLSHPNIITYYGTLFENVLEVVSPWVENGNILKYIGHYPDTDRLQMMLGASKGLAYIHGCNIVHSHVKCSNILVSEKGVPVVSDIGLTKLSCELCSYNSATTDQEEAEYIRWNSPEYITADAGNQYTFQNDVYAFGMTMLECVTLKYPYSHIHRSAYVIRETVVERRPPPRPSGPNIDTILTDEWWSLMNRCWVSAKQRPTMAEVVESLQTCSSQNGQP